jgi:hypothetical protein
MRCVLEEEPLERLRAQLGGTLPEGLRTLEKRQLEHLDEIVRAARRRQAQALAEAGDRALGFVPRLLRGPIRRIMR